MSTHTVELPEELEKYVSKSVETGRFDDANSVIRAALSTMEREETEYRIKLDALRAEIEKGLASGIADGDIDDVFARVRQKVGLPSEGR
jgi:antitoxin ParD1/3/4